MTYMFEICLGHGRLLDTLSTILAVVFNTLGKCFTWILQDWEASRICSVLIKMYSTALCASFFFWAMTALLLRCLLISRFFDALVAYVVLVWEGGDPSSCTLLCCLGWAKWSWFARKFGVRTLFSPYMCLLMPLLFCLLNLLVVFLLRRIRRPSGSAAGLLRVVGWVGLLLLLWLLLTLFSCRLLLFLEFFI